MPCLIHHSDWRFQKVCLADVGMKEIAALASLTCVIPPTAGSALQGLHRTYMAELLYEYESPANPLHVVNYRVSSTNVGRESLAGWRMHPSGTPPCGET